MNQPLSDYEILRRLWELPYDQKLNPPNDWPAALRAEWICYLQALEEPETPMAREGTIRSVTFSGPSLGPKRVAVVEFAQEHGGPCESIFVPAGVLPAAKSMLVPGSEISCWCDFVEYFDDEWTFPDPSLLVAARFDPSLHFNPPRFDEQLVMPWGHRPPQILWEGRIPGETGRHDIEFLLTQENSRLTLAIAIVETVVSTSIVANATLLLDVGAEAKCTIELRDHTYGRRENSYAWDMSWLMLGRDGPFEALQKWASQFAGDNWEWWGFQQVAVRKIRKLCLLSSQRARDLCDSQALELAQRFDDSVRFEIYGQILRKGTRFAQMVLVCPGVVLIARELRRNFARGSAKSIESSIARGDRLAQTICIAWRLWCEEEGTEWGSQDKWRAQQLLIRHATAATDPIVLMTLVHAGIEVSDIPRDQCACEAWYRIVGLFYASSVRWKTLPTRSAGRLAGFVSRYAATIERHGNGNSGEQFRVYELVEFCLRSGEKLPSRQSDPERVLRASMAWYVGVLRSGHSKLPPETPLPRCEMGSPKEPLATRLLTSVAELQIEGAKMDHCIQSYADDAAAGRLFVFSASYGFEELTIALKKRGSVMTLVEVAGTGNAATSPAAKIAIEEWVRAGSRPELGRADRAAMLPWPRDI